MSDTATTVTADIGDIVRIVNKGSAAFYIQWDSKVYTLEPEKDAFVPFEAACLWFGDPRSTGTIRSTRDNKGLVGFVPDREAEVRRLRVKFGNLGGDERFVQNAPNIEVYDIQGTRIVTVLDDPEGKVVNVSMPTVQDRETERAAVQTMQLQLAQEKRVTDLLLTRLGLSRKDLEDAASGEVDDDDEPFGDGTPLDLTDDDTADDADTDDTDDGGAPPEDDTE